MTISLRLFIFCHKKTPQKLTYKLKKMAIFKSEILRSSIAVFEKTFFYRIYIYIHEEILEYKKLDIMSRKVFWKSLIFNLFYIFSPKPCNRMLELWFSLFWHLQVRKAWICICFRTEKGDKKVKTTNLYYFLNHLLKTIWSNFQVFCQKLKICINFLSKLKILFFAK